MPSITSMQNIFQVSFSRANVPPGVDQKENLLRIIEDLQEKRTRRIKIATWQPFKKLSTYLDG